MKNLLLAILILSTTHCFAQDWVDYKFDDNLTLTIPVNFVTFDTLGHHVTKAPIDNAVIMIQRISNAHQAEMIIGDLDDLRQSYTGFQKGVIDAQHGKVIAQKWIRKDGVQFTEFSFEAGMGQEKQIGHALVFFLNGKWYAVQFGELASMSNALAAQRDRLFSSIKLPPDQSLKNQLTSGEKDTVAYKMGYVLAAVIFFVLLPGGLIIVIVSLVKAARRRSRKNASL